MSLPTNIIASLLSTSVIDNVEITNIDKAEFLVIMNGVNKFMQDSKLYQISKFDKNIHNKIGAAGAVIGGFVGSLPGLAMGNLKTAATGAVIGSTISGLYNRNKAKKRAENIVKDYESKYGKNAYTTFMKKK